MICPLLTYADMQKAMAGLAEVFELRIVWLSDDDAEILWNGGVAVAQTDQPEVLHGSHVGYGWTYRTSLRSRCALLDNTQPWRSRPQRTTPFTLWRSANTAPAIERAKSGPSDPTSSAANAGMITATTYRSLYSAAASPHRQKVTPRRPAHAFRITFNGHRARAETTIKI